MVIKLLVCIRLVGFNKVAPCLLCFFPLISPILTTLLRVYHTLEPFKELGLDSQRVKELVFKLRVHSVNYAAKLVHTRRALDNTIINCHQETVSGQACKPLADPN